MEWLEIVKVRMGGRGDRDLDAESLKRMAAELTAPTLAGVRVYANVSISNDLMIILTWRDGIPAPWGSELALGLARELKARGLVDYSVWSGMD